MVRASEASPDNGPKSQIPHSPILSKEEIIGNSFIFLFAGHETSANSIHYSILYLAINRPSQKHMQSDIDNIVGGKPTADFSYHLDMPRLYNSMVGAVMNEQLRLMPAILSVPKVTNGDQVVTMDGREFMIKDRTCIQINVTGTNRNPRYWPSSPSKITPETDDLNDFVPERWLNSKSDGIADKPVVTDEGEGQEGLEQVSFETTSFGSLFKPIKGSFTTFSEGMRACPGRRFAQVEITAVLAMIFQKYSVELDVAEWASDEELVMMGKEEKRVLYEKAKAKARAIMARAKQETITLQFVKGDHVPVRFVLRGKERFGDIY
jgi:cytochrome P450